MFAVNTGTASSPFNVDAPVTAKQAAEERRGSRFVRSCFSLAELDAAAHEQPAGGGERAASAAARWEQRLDVSVYGPRLLHRPQHQC